LFCLGAKVLKEMAFFFALNLFFFLLDQEKETKRSQEQTIACALLTIFMNL